MALGQVMEVDNITAVPEDVITRLAASGPVGRLLFESGLLRFMAAQVCAVIEQEVQKMLGEEKVFSLDEIEARKRSVYEMAMAIDGIELLPCKRHIDINYGKLKVKQVECEGLSHEVSLRFSSAIKHIGVADEVLAPVHGESFLGEHKRAEREKAQFQDDVLLPMREARTKLGSHLKGHDVKNADEMMQKMEEQAFRHE